MFTVNTAQSHCPVLLGGTPNYEATHLGQQLGYFSCVQSLLHQLLNELDINFAV